MSALAERARKAREFRETFDGFRLVLRAPNAAEVARHVEAGRDDLAYAEQFVIGWEDVTEADLPEVFPSGGEAPVPFDRDLWREVLGARMHLWGPVVRALLERYQAQRDEVAAREKQ